MATLVRCDNCKAEGQEQSVVGWFKVDSFGISTISFGRTPSPWHFCSEQCLGEWAHGH